MDFILKDIEQLSCVDDPFPILMDLKVKLIAVPTRDIQASFASKYPVSSVKPLFDILNSSNRDQVKLCIEILDLIMTNIDQKCALNCLKEQYVRCLDHPDEYIRLMVMKQLLLYCEDTRCIPLLLQDITLIHIILEKLGDKNMDVVKYAHKIILTLCSQNILNNSVETVIDGDGANVLNNVMNTSDSARFHVYDIVIKLCLVNEHNLLYLASLGFIMGLMNELSTGDVLTQLNALELLSELASNSCGLKFLQTTGIITKLSYILSTSCKDAMAAILLPGILKFFGNLGSVHPQLLAEDESIVLAEIMKIASDFSSGTEIYIQLISFETLAHIGASLEGKDALLKYTIEMENTIKDLTSHFKSFPTEMQVRVLDSVAELFTLKKENHSDDLCSRMEIWFQHLSEESPMKFVYDIAKQPFLDLLCSCLRIMKSVAVFPWGVRKMAQEPGLIEWLLERSSGRDKASKELQWEIIEVLSHDSYAKEFFTEEVNSRFSKYYEQGPFFVDAEHSVAFEGEP